MAIIRIAKRQSKDPWEVVRAVKQFSKLSPHAGDLADARRAVEAGKAPTLVQYAALEDARTTLAAAQPSPDTWFGV